MATDTQVPVFSMKTTVIARANTYTHSSCKQLCKRFEDNRYGQEWRLMAISLGRNKESKLKPTFTWFFPWRQCENEGETASIKQYSFWAKLTKKHSNCWPPPKLYMFRVRVQETQQKIVAGKLKAGQRLQYLHSSGEMETRVSANVEGLWETHAGCSWDPEMSHPEAKDHTWEMRTRTKIMGLK